jgi:hypothetical protein
MRQTGPVRRTATILVIGDYLRSTFSPREARHLPECFDNASAPPEAHRLIERRPSSFRPCFYRPTEVGERALLACIDRLPGPRLHSCGNLLGGWVKSWGLRVQTERDGPRSVATHDLCEKTIKQDFSDDEFSVEHAREVRNNGQIGFEKAVSRLFCEL